MGTCASVDLTGHYECELSDRHSNVYHESGTRRWVDLSSMCGDRHNGWECSLHKGHLSEHQAWHDHHIRPRVRPGEKWPRVRPGEKWPNVVNRLLGIKEPVTPTVQKDEWIDEIDCLPDATHEEVMSLPSWQDLNKRGRTG